MPGGDVFLHIASTKGQVTVWTFLAILSLLAQDLLSPSCVILATFLIHLLAVLCVTHASLLVDLLPVGFVPSFVVHGGLLYTITTFSFVVSHESTSTSSSDPSPCPHYESTPYAS